MILLALDPGMTTGWARFQVNGPYASKPYTQTVNVKTGNIVFGHLEEQLEILAGASKGVSHPATSHPLTVPNIVIIERLPDALNPEMRMIQSLCFRQFPTHILVSPGQWKPYIRNLALKGPFERGKSTQHERDAWGMGIYWLRAVYKQSGLHMMEKAKASNE